MRKVIADKGKKAAERFMLLPRTLTLIWRAARVWTVAWLVLAVVQGLIPAATVYLTKFVVDAAAEAIGAGVSWEAVRPVFVPGALMAGLMLLAHALNGVSTWVRTAQSELVRDYTKSLIHEKATSVDLAFYESPSYYDHLSRANTEAGTRSLSILQSIGGFIENTTTLISVAVLLMGYSVWLPLLLLISVLPAFKVLIRYNRLQHDWWDETTKDRRWAEYYDMILTHPRSASEVRLFGLSDLFHSLYQSLRRTLRETRLRLMRDQSLAQLRAGVTALIITGVAVAWVVLQGLRGAASIGDLAFFYQAFNQGQGLMRSVLSHVGRLYADALYLEHLFTFLSLEPEIVSAPSAKPVRDHLAQGIVFRDVTFHYPDSEHAALRDFNLTIPAGKTVAIVGPNGAGKSTLIKLLCRFYDPRQGTVEWDGTDLRALDLDELRRRITIMFQTPIQHAATVTDNIAFGDLSKEPTDTAIVDAAIKGRAHEIVEGLVHGYQTLLGKQFEGGTELSGGQWQRIALARAFYRQAPLVILDEPTSFMDSWAEHLWLERFVELVHGRTALIVTHRFTTAMRADIIHVMENGRIVESGSHDQLVEQDGAYAESWTAQVGATSRRAVGM